MRYAVIGGDMRFAHLVSMLNESGRFAAGFLQEKAGAEKLSLDELKGCDAVISNWPMRWPLSEQSVEEEEIFENIAPGSMLLLCGPKFPQERRRDLHYANLWEDERLLQENAYLTAEAAVAAAMRRSGRSMQYARCAVIGYGRIGRSLTEILLNIGAHVVVFSRSEEKRRLVRQRGARDASDIIEATRDAELIFSTPPAMVLGRDELQALRKDTLVMDLASPPYGVDLEAAQELGLQACREPGLPGRYCPLSAARAIYNAVLRWEGDEKNG